MIPVLATERLTLRGPQVRDFEPIAAFLASDRARYVGGKRSRRDAWRTFAALVGHWELRGYGMWSVEETATGAYRRAWSASTIPRAGSRRRSAGGS